MSAPINDGGPAFPSPTTYHLNGQVEYGTFGMSLRDWFAGQVLAGIMSARSYTDVAEWVPARAYEIADAMLAERSKGGAK